MPVTLYRHPARLQPAGDTLIHTRLTWALPGWVGLLCLVFGALATGARAQTPAPAAAPAPPAKTVVAQAAFSSPVWTELSPVEREILKPLASTWNRLSQTHKRKWLQMTKSYPALSTEEQVKMQGRMKEWVALSPQQRAQARLNFAKTKELSKELTAEERQAKWQAYQALSDEEKRKLAAKAPPKPAGAAPAAKPVAAQKLATVPSRADKQKAKPATKITVTPPPAGQPDLLSTTAPAATPGVVPAKP
ncbi:MAG: DUF3106 domain-containing protein [Polaromonas sp.]|uniref:DUF3106 domain-containing protein n=1 Tax=Polaromonas sp. TaxID=1869339 RepID=UPI00272FDDB9|nr:DUF3106 domain-containing protein [Polaromonas sp.]MDP2451049.1 DUF3106 domain-containing protein [Polaromonas sp.]MDP3248223.1 DUF3106 domain-containing protein [Polaromonas sp.]MDP3755292.1 DUF3106 domain-containing protein [Polaromonas sp.]MDP3826510.1 DUF3106 domain-containing protein [Polaromonas sp.]